MNIAAYSLLISVVIPSLLIFTNFGSFILGIYSWLINIVHLRSLPSPPRRWLLGHALKVNVIHIAQ